MIPALALVALAGSSALQRVRLKVDPAMAFPLLLVGLALFLLVGAELFYVVDQFGGGFRRMNTVFKTYYQAWLLLGIAGITATPFLVWAGLAFFVTWIDDGTGAAFGEVGGRMVLVIPALALVALAGSSALQRVRLKVDPAMAFPLLLVGLALFLLVGAELFYVVDQFGGGFRRMNTVFKTYYQAWLLLGIAGTYGLYYLWSARSPVRSSTQSGRFTVGPVAAARFVRGGRYLWAGTAAVLLVASFYYPVGAVLDRTGILRDGHTVSDNTLDGLAFLRQPAPGEYRP